MRAIFTSTKIFLVIAFFVGISSCERQSCKNVACPVGQQCNTGRCFCADGYENAPGSTTCDQYAYLKYVASNRSWNVYESCYGSSSNFPSYTCFFQPNTSDFRQVYIYNLLGSNCSVLTAIIHTDGSNQGNILEIPTQNCGGITVSGQAAYYSTPYVKIVFQLNYTFNGGTYQCTETFQ